MRAFLSVTRLVSIWERLRGSFWFLPSLMAAGAVILSFAAVQLDAAMEADAYGRFEFIYLFGPEGARAILSAVATSMITVAGLTFSITMLTLQLASSQFGPRLLRNFMRDRGNQLVLGTFISTFVYCLLVLRTVKGVEGSSFVPHLAVAIGVVLAVAGLAVLIYFIHHTASSIRIETLLASLADETAATIDRLFPERLGDEEPATDVEPPEFDQGYVIRPKASGYVQSVDSAALLRLATEEDLIVSVVTRPGSFVTERDVLLRVLAATSLPEDQTDALRSTLIVGIERTPYQDLDFSVRRIVEIAQRALSPGINDPTTALYCIDRLREALVRLAERRTPSSYRHDDEGRLRIVAEPVSFEAVAVGAFAAVAHYAGSDTDVLEALAPVLDAVIAAAEGKDRARLVGLRRSLRERLSDAR
ncbi:DUF2254 domain-containing protein [Reyranella sp.]|jgi:uncharacterized membrane protein|uniref:DUF2254 domain-containing protein n=1 Tax=Reyranella sp. TaxID=1929291 RepID=UPI000BDD5543|nr:DUF2254 domain-containing protein [Reyranella sp.]OYY37215.1 MAG: hypothetical protein B7Y57_23470 [Rhodospirillales bacterium 35-66-84]OYZ94187.1 MAG: hypothetical protein B7Y08_13705 [Rhodospirillales bacterium 24-66-33]OZB23027.1 MAG: hypothetical protein B7X63_20850 [Rhodospirillales bacterium 39-66-50]HQS17204.1 DUF2254 domain-containing protein [Reyranella sp.]HQT13725.1 DUF2254 domain-containing protein [Reyranella sp.]